MTLKQLQYIVMIVETGNITEAAREVQIAAFSTACWRSKWWYKVKFLQFSPGNKDSDSSGKKDSDFPRETKIRISPRATKIRILSWHPYLHNNK